MTKLKNPEPKGWNLRLVAALFNFNYCEANPPSYQRKTTFARRQKRAGRKKHPFKTKLTGLVF